MKTNSAVVFAKIVSGVLCVLLNFSLVFSVFAADSAKGACDQTKTPGTLNTCYLEQLTKVSKDKINLISGAEAPLTVSGQSHNVTLKKTLEDVIDALIMIIGTVALALIVFAGFRLIAASGNDTEITRAKDILKQTVIGFAIALLAYVIIGVWQGFLFR